jgi:hypothetical protein
MRNHERTALLERKISRARATIRGLKKIAAHLEVTKLAALEGPSSSIIEQMIALSDRAMRINRRFVDSAVKTVAALRRAK